jgi:ribosomal protein S27AE
MVKTKTADIKAYRNEYYAKNKEKFQAKTKVCMYCGNTCSSGNMNKHIKTKKHLSNKVEYFLKHMQHLENIGNYKIPEY